MGKRIFLGNGYENNFAWKVDRSNPNRMLPLHYEGMAKMRVENLG